MRRALPNPFGLFSSWLFQSGPSESLAVMRILFCGIGFLSTLYQYPYLEDFYTDRGILPVTALKLWQWRGWTPGLINGWSLSSITVLWAVTCVSALFATLGVMTRWSLGLFVLGLIAFQNRSPLILNSGDTLLRINLLYLLFSECGASFSIDAYRRSKQGLRSPREVPLWPQRLIQIQIATLYLAATWYKFQGELWRRGLVTWVIFRLEELRRFPLPDWLLTERVSQVLTWGTLLIELALCTLIWFKPYRTAVILSGVALHAGISFVLNIPFFSWITMSCYVSFYSGDEIRSFWTHVRSRLRPFGGIGSESVPSSSS